LERKDLQEASNLLNASDKEMTRQERKQGMARSQREKAESFRKLHEAQEAFFIPNFWDVGSAKILEGMGFPALATSSAASAMTIGKRDGELSRDEAIAHARSVSAATNVPVSADLENGFADSPDEVAETVRQAAAAGLAGCTIEDTTGNDSAPLYEIAAATERIAAGAQAARKLDFPFMLTARAHNFLYPNPSLDDTIRRLQAYENAGADVLFALGLPNLASVRAVCQAVTKPVNFMVGIPGISFTAKELAEAGVRRISLATSLYRAAMTGLLTAAKEVQEKGTFGFVESSAPSSEFVRLMGI
jgi:2-methylisocitrate lyase-like PEP mutase family enzyme